MKRLFVAFALPTLLIVQDAAAKIITQCGASEGYGYYFEGSLINPKDAVGKRTVSRMAVFSLPLTTMESHIILTDIIGTRSAKGDGANVSTSGGQPGFYQVLTVYPGLYLDDRSISMPQATERWFGARCGRVVSYQQAL